MLAHAIKRLKKLLTELHHDHTGSALIFVGLGLLVLVGAAGSAIDMSRLQAAQTKLSNALDAAGLAAGAKAHSGDINAVVQNYLNVNFPDGFMDSTITDVSVQISPDNTIITLSATASVNMKFMQIFGHEATSIHATSEITRENRGLEMVMVLDVTGSMAGSKISDLRVAATDMVNILFGPNESLDNLWVGVVPYVTAVNIGSDKTAWLRDYDLSRYPSRYPNHAVKWKGCVEARNQWPENNGLDMTDAPPYTGDPATATTQQRATMFPMYFWESAADNRWITSGNNVSLNQNAHYSDGDARGPNIGCATPVTPLSSSKTTVQNAVNALIPWRRGGTMSSEGLAWGWRLISPRWRGLWDSSNPTLPLDYDTPLMSKAVIVMTDGVNEVFRYGTSGPGGSDYTSYGRIEERNLGSNVNTRARGISAVNDKFSQICSNMKAEGILVYTVTFQLNNSSASNNARTLFRNCATHPDFYFDSPDGATLRQAFRTIGDSLANLMISR